MSTEQSITTEGLKQTPELQSERLLGLVDEVVKTNPDLAREISALRETDSQVEALINKILPLEVGKTIIDFTLKQVEETEGPHAA